MSLKFAEVEGERQILVMTVRNLKSFHKGWEFPLDILEPAMYRDVTGVLYNSGTQFIMNKLKFIMVKYVNSSFLIFTMLTI
jgi:hypothetical protein